MRLARVRVRVRVRVRIRVRVRVRVRVRARVVTTSDATQLLCRALTSQCYFSCRSLARWPVCRLREPLQ